MFKQYADGIIDDIDPKGLIKHRLYREHTTVQNNQVIKDISKTGRDMAKTIIVDNLPSNFLAQPFNGIHIKTWEDDLKDMELKHLADILVGLAKRKVADLRIPVRKLNERMKRSGMSFGNISVESILE